ncbi:hypothetical protein C8R43DRAFT_1025174 [Mycena crocata]|nr:hypothetical protein C8R43DRAFT_1025174 [Mycena crocata]
MPPRKNLKKASARLRKPLRLNGHETFLDLPLDILLEILKVLHPLDLLYLSRTNKALREFLLDRGNAFIWRATFDLLEGSPPKCPSFSCEPKWTRLLFEEVCHVCLSDLEPDFQFDPIWWESGARYCSDCASDQSEYHHTYGLISHSDFLHRVEVKLPKKLIYPAASGSDSRIYQRYARPWDDVFPRVRSYYLAKDINEFMEQYLTLKAHSEKLALIQARREQTKPISEHAKICRAWKKIQVDARLDELRNLKRARRTDIITKLREAATTSGWEDRDHINLDHYVSQSRFDDLVAIPERLTDAEWDTIGPKLLAELEVTVKARVLGQRSSMLEWVLFRDLKELTKHLEFQPRIVDVARIPEVRAILETDVKVKLEEKDLREAVEPKLPRLVAAWSAAFAVQLRDHTRTLLRMPSDSTEDPLGRALAYFVCKSNPCQGHFTGQWQPCRDGYGGHPWTPENTFNMQRARPVLEDVIELYGKDPQTATCEEMDAAPGTLWCMRCKMENQPTGWRDAPAHSMKSHEKFSSLRARFVVEVEAEE